MKGGRSIRESEQETNDIIPMHDQLDQTRVSHNEDILHRIIYVALGKGVVFPIIDERFVIRPANALRPADQFLLGFEILDPQVAALQCPLGDAFHPLRNLERLSWQIAGDKVDFFFKTKRFNQPGILIKIVIHHGHHLALVEPFDQDPISIEWG